MYLDGEFLQTLSRAASCQQARTPMKDRSNVKPLPCKSLCVHKWEFSIPRGCKTHRLADIIRLNVTRSNGVVVSCLKRPHPNMGLRVTLAE